MGSTSVPTATLLKLKEEIGFLKEVNSSLIANQSQWQKQLLEKEEMMRRQRIESSQHIADLEEQVRDLMFALDAGAQLQRKGMQAGEDHAIVTVASPPPPARSSGTARKSGVAAALAAKAASRAVASANSSTAAGSPAGSSHSPCAEPAAVPPTGTVDTSGNVSESSGSKKKSKKR
jgi:hypothetical protein